MGFWLMKGATFKCLTSYECVGIMSTCFSTRSDWNIDITGCHILNTCQMYSPILQRHLGDPVLPENLANQGYQQIREDLEDLENQEDPI